MEQQLIRERYELSMARILKFQGEQTVTEPYRDFFTAIIFGTTAGYLVGFIAVPQFAVGILLFGGASYILPLVTDTMLANFKACGGIITLAVGLKIAGIKRTKVLNILPAIAIIFPLSCLL